MRSGFFCYFCVNNQAWMKSYETPSCRCRSLDLEVSFLNGGSAGGFPVDPVDPFGTSSGLMEEGYDE